MSDGPDQSPDAPRTPPPSQRRWIALAVALFLLVQLAIPFRYYRDTSSPDERFAWRMFSSVHMTDCKGMLIDVIDEHGVRVDRRVVDDMVLPWRGMLERNRRDVIDKLLRWRCAQPGVLAARYERRCITPDGRSLPVERLILDSPDGVIRAVADPSP